MVGMLAAGGLLLLAGAGVVMARGAPEVSLYVWWPSIRRFRRQDEVRPWPADAVVLYGSSTFRLWTTAEEDLAPWPVVNRGFGGARTSDLLAYADRVLGPHRPRAVVLYVANDISGSLWDISPVRAARQFRDLLSTVRRLLPATPVVWLAVNPTVRRWAVWDRTCELNRRFAEVCGTFEGVHTVSVADDLLSGGHPDPRFFIEDRLHPSVEGYAVIAAGLRDALRTHAGRPE